MASTYRFDTNTTREMIGNRIRRQTIQRWFHWGWIKGARQAQANAKVWLTAEGVLETWYLWADRAGLDRDAHMPPKIKKLRKEIIEEMETTASAPEAPQVPTGTGIPVKVIVPPGTQVQVVYEG